MISAAVKSKSLCAVSLMLMFTITNAGFLGKEKQPDLKPDATWRWPVSQVPLLNKAPKIDGVVEKREWLGAAELSPCMDFTTGVECKRRVRTYIAYSRDGIYLAFKFNRAKHWPAPIANKKGKIWQDDCVEFFLQPDPEKNQAFNFAGNAARTYSDGITKTATDNNWNAKWNYKATRTSDGWEGEIFVSFKELGCATPKPGTVWGFNMFRNRKTPVGGLACWSFMTGWNRKDDFGYLIFGGEIPAVQVREAGEVGSEDVGALVSVSNFTGKPAEVTVSCKVLKPKNLNMNYYKFLEGEADTFGTVTDATAKSDIAKVIKKALKSYDVVLTKSRKGKVNPNTSFTAVMAKNLPPGSYVVRYMVVDGQKRVLSGGTIPFVKTAPLQLSYIPYFLTAKCVSLSADLSRLKGLDAKSRFRAETVDAKGKKCDSVEVAIPFGREDIEIDIPTAKIPAGGYKLNVKVLSGKGKVLATNSITMKKPPEPAWANNKLGFPDTPPLPWTPVKTDGNKVRLLDKELVFGKDLLPQKISVEKTEILAAPVQLEINGETGFLNANGKLVSADKTQANYLFTGTVKGLDVKLALTVEFDGFMRYDLEILPGKAKKLASLRLNVPFKKEIATLYTRHGLGTPPHFKQLKSKYAAAPLPGNGLNSKFTCAVWLGNDRRGMQWFCESDEKWFPRNNKKAIEIIRGKDTVVFRANIVAVAEELTGPLKLSWAFLPTPAKPYDQAFLWNNLICQSGIPTYLGNGKYDRKKLDNIIKQAKNAGANAVIGWAWPKQIWNPRFGNPCLYDKDRIKAMKSFVDEMHKHGIKVLVYAIWGSMYPDQPEFKFFGREMARAPYNFTYGGAMDYCPAKTFTDWYVYSLAQTIKNTGIDGVYLDSSPIPQPCGNKHHGCGYKDEKNKLHCTYPIFGVRELHKRVYCLFNDDKNHNTIIYAHNTAPPFMASESFVDVHHCAEGSSLPLEQWRSRFYGRPYGLPVIYTYWNQSHYPRRRINAWACALQVDAELKATTGMFPPHTRWIPKDKYTEKAYLLSKIKNFKKHFDWKNAEWHPYWRNQRFVKTKKPETMCALYLNKGRDAWLTVTNWTDKQLLEKVSLNLKEMGLEPGKIQIEDIITGENVPVSATGDVAIDIIPFGPRLLYIKNSKP